MANEKRLIDGNKAQAVLVNMAEHLMEAGNHEMAGAVGYVAEVIGKQRTVDAVELPCKVGDMVYRKDGAWNVVGFECNRGGGWRVKLERWKNQFRDCHETTKVVFNSFGKTVFLTREEAESELTKMDGDGNA